MNASKSFKALFLLCCALCPILGFALLRESKQSGDDLRFDRFYDDRPIVRGALSCESPHVNFGVRYRPVGIVEHRFTIRNRSDSRKSVRVAQTSCTCTSARVEPEVLDAGEEATVLANWEVPNRVGAIDFAVYVSSGDSRGDLLPLTGTIAVRDVLTFKPDRLDFGDLCPGRGIEEMIELNGFDGPLPVSIRLASESASPEFTVAIVEHSAGQMRVKVGVTGVAGMGSRDYSVRLETGDAKQPLIEVPVHVNHLGRFRLAPSDILINRPTAATTKYVRVVGCGDATPTIEKIEVLPEWTFDVRVHASNGNVKVGFSPTIDGPWIGHHQAGEARIFIRGEDAPLKMSYFIVR